MKIALIGYGRMGKEIEEAAIQRGHEVILRIDKDNMNDLSSEKLSAVDVAIEFTLPETAYQNVKACFDANTPVVSGTTGWNDQLPEVISDCKQSNQTFFYASNYSIGVNLFFQMNKQLARLMNNYPAYDVSMEEVHHIHKQDAPSGTAITLADKVIAELDKKNKWELDKVTSDDSIEIKAIREDMVPGIHRLKYESDFDHIKVEHSAKSRKGFALGAVLAAEFIYGKKGYFTMEDLLNN